MIPWTLLDTAKIPGGGELRLKRRGSEFSIMLSGNELMNSRLSGSEQALATLAAKKIQACPRPNVLIGGLGMGFTLRAALEAFGSNATITVAELVPAVVAWARGPMAELFGPTLDDSRVVLRRADVAQLIGSARATYNAILLDVDNGPDGLTARPNDRLYDLAGLAAARAGLKTGGVLAVWSSGPDEKFTQRLKKRGFSVEMECVRANGARGGARHFIWLAVRPASNDSH